MVPTLKDTLSFDNGLSDDELIQFQKEGWVGCYNILDDREIKKLCIARRLVDHSIYGPLDMNSAPPSDKVWFKSLHEVSQEFYNLALHPLIIGRIKSILGNDFLVWGVSTKTIPPGGGHRWHVDVEHRKWHGVTVFLGLQNVSDKSTLKLITRSHKIKCTPQNFHQNEDGDLVEICKKQEPLAELKVVNPGSGGFFIFDGRIWHGSKNSSSLARTAVIIQFCKTDQRVRVPLNWDEPLKWGEDLPACAIGHGSDLFGFNRIISKAQER